MPIRDRPFMTEPAYTTAELDAAGLVAHLDDLCRVLMDSVEDGAAISFMAPLSRTVAERFWLSDVTAAVEGGSRHLFGALIASRLVGTVQLVVGMPPNQPHRAEISKMVVHPDNRRRGIGKALMSAALAVATQSGKTLVTLDTRTGDVSEDLYRGMGFVEAGRIPDFAFDPDRQAMHGTTYMYRYL